VRLPARAAPPAPRLTHRVPLRPRTASPAPSGRGAPPALRRAFRARIAGALQAAARRPLRRVVSARAPRLSAWTRPRPRRAVSLPSRAA
jgi:hypothetical protein